VHAKRVWLVQVFINLGVDHETFSQNEPKNPKRKRKTTKHKKKIKDKRNYNI